VPEEIWLLALYTDAISNKRTRNLFILGKRWFKLFVGKAVFSAIYFKRRLPLALAVVKNRLKIELPYFILFNHLDTSLKIQTSQALLK